jgi:hypothetical protein
MDVEHVVMRRDIGPCERLGLDVRRLAASFVIAGVSRDSARADSASRQLLQNSLYRKQHITRCGGWRPSTALTLNPATTLCGTARPFRRGRFVVFSVM